MRRQQIEATVVSYVDVVVRGGRVEDQMVELKSAWPEDHAKAARRIAGHANAAHGEEIMWIIGVDEDAHQVIGAGDVDPANWWPRVEKRFDEVAPDCQPLTVAVGDGLTVVALVFTTDRAPYAVSTDGAGGVQFEIPYRPATGTRTARRHELVRMLVPALAVPSVELIAATLRIMFQPDRPAEIRGTTSTAGSPARLSYQFEAMLFIDAAHPTMLPTHLRSHTLLLRAPDGAPTQVPTSPEIQASTQSSDRRNPSRSSVQAEPPPTGPGQGAHVRWAGIYVTGPDLLGLADNAELPMELRQPSEDAAAAAFEVTMGIARSEQRVVIAADLRRDFSQAGQDPQPAVIREVSRFTYQPPAR